HKGHTGDRHNRAYLRERFSASARRNVAEKYYDCLQCAEQCRHVTNIVTSTNNNNNNNNNNSNSSNNNVKLEKCAKSNILIPSNGTNNCRLTSPLSSTMIKEDPKALALACLDDFKTLTNSKSTKLSGSLKIQPLFLTPAKKRSSLARPVRVHDSFTQPKKLLPANYAFQTLQKRETNESTYEDDEHEETSWPIRLRFEQMLELTLPQTKKRRKKKTSMRLMKQQQQTRHVCKDTERLLRVLSVNNVDQDNRYNVTRCSVM
ncbi:putative uncharacterized protein DDB_G0291608, partial [Hylaeus anthracinus]|uniref:putative uncharacterized protein DDB_G0291608 n=1 Tax=Hylaeus anthracinus TaxID=313031 RepID=UPI0023BA125C